VCTSPENEIHNYDDYVRLTANIPDGIIYHEDAFQKNGRNYRRSVGEPTILGVVGLVLAAIALSVQSNMSVSICF
jgi:hypothetical protein